MMTHQSTSGFGSEDQENAVEGKDAWETPAIVSYTPAKTAQGIGVNPGDGTNNLS